MRRAKLRRLSFFRNRLPAVLAAALIFPCAVARGQIVNGCIKHPFGHTTFNTFPLPAPPYEDGWALQGVLKSRGNFRSYTMRTGANLLPVCEGFFVVLFSQGSGYGGPAGPAWQSVLTSDPFTINSGDTISFDYFVDAKPVIPGFGFASHNVNVKLVRSPGSQNPGVNVMALTEPQATSGWVSFTSGPLPVGTWQLEFTMSDNVTTQLADQAALGLDNIRVIGTNTPPVADAGTDLTICPNAAVVLQGSGTDADGDPLTFAWSILSQPSGSAPVLSPLDVATPGFTSSTSGEYVVSLVVDDGTDPSLPDTITITVQPDLPPVAVATADVVAGTAPLSVNFDGSGSFDPMSPCANAPLTYSWSFGDGNTSTEASPTHTYVLPANYTVSLVVTDSALQTDSETLTISAQLPDFPPTVAPTATPITGPAPLLVTFDAGANDPEGAPVTFGWGFDDPSSPNNSSTAASPTHTYNAPGTYVALVTVSDGTNTVLGNVTVVVEEPIPPLDLDARSLKIKLRKRGARSKLHMRGMITAGLPDPSAVLRLSADGILVFEAPFSEFVLAGNDADDDDADEAGVDDDVNPSHYKLKRKHLRVELNASTGRLDVKARRLDLSGRPARNAVVLEMSIDDATAVQCLPVRVRCRGNVLVFRKR